MSTNAIGFVAQILREYSILVVMKLNNQDITRLTEIRIYFREPPYSFKLSGYALLQVEESIGILKKYPATPASLIASMEAFLPKLIESEKDIPATMELMKRFAVLLNEINR
jgi:hypothetical protein